MPRLFTAIEIPDALRQRLASLRGPFPGARWVNEADLHLTLRFVGELSRRQADEFARAVADIHIGSPEVRIRGTGSFGGKQPHTVYAIVEPDPALLALAEAHDRAARSIGLPPEARKFVPHVTLARLQTGDDATVAKFLERTGNLRLAPFYPSRTVLMSSRDGGGGPYGVVDAFPFAGHDPGDEP
jgi:2'-5' RNA ligase